MTLLPKLSKREREVMDLFHKFGEATVTQLRDRMEDAPSNPATRSILRILVKKGHLKFEQDGPRYLYSATVEATTAKRSALKHVLTTFFDGSVEGTIAALLEFEESKMTDKERKRVMSVIDRVEKEGR